MSKDLKKYKARIFGELYPIVSDEDETVILDIVRKVDALMNDISAKYENADVKTLAILAALKSTEEAVSLQKKLLNEEYQSNKIINLLDKEISF